jgi:hypothetical protein
MVGDIGFSVADFEAYVAGLRKPDWAKIFKTVMDDHHEMLARLAKSAMECPSHASLY